MINLSILDSKTDVVSADYRYSSAVCLSKYHFINNPYQLCLPRSPVLLINNNVIFYILLHHLNRSILQIDL